MHTKIRQEGAVLVVEFDGQLAFKARAEVLDRILPAMREQRIRRVLLDFTGAWPSRDKDDAAEVLASKLVANARALESTAIAYLNAPHGHAEPAELVAPVVGFQVQRFYNRKVALAWLEHAAGDASNDARDP